MKPDMHFLWNSNIGMVCFQTISKNLSIQFLQLLINNFDLTFGYFFLVLPTKDLTGIVLFFPSSMLKNILSLELAYMQVLWKVICK